MSLPPEVLKKVKLLEISTRKLVNNIFAGEYQTLFKGQGMTFSDFREYVPGDDIRTISWQLTARTGKTFIKIFEEERELTMVLAVDVSGSTDFGSGSYFKGEVMTHLAALLAFSAAKNNDQVGLLLFSDQVEHYVPPKKGRGHVQRLLRDMYYYKPKSHLTKMSVAVEYLQSVLKKRATIFILSDFMDTYPQLNADASLRLLGKKHDVTACVVNDPTELDLPDMGIIDVQDPETGEILTVDSSSSVFREEYKKNVQKARNDRDQMFKKAQIEKMEVINHEDFTQPLIDFFKKRKRNR